MNQLNKNQQDIFEEYLNKKCEHHQNYCLSYIHFDKSSKQVIKCSKCLKSIDEDKFQLSNLILLREILESDEKTIIDDLPQLSDRTLFKLLKQKEYFQDIEGQTLKQISEFCDSFKKEVCDRIDEAFKKVKSKIDTLSSLKSEVLNEYNRVSQKLEIKELFKNETNNLDSEIYKIMHSQLEKIEENTKAINIVIQKFKMAKESINFNTPNQIKDNVLQTIKQLDFFSDLQIEQIHDQIKNFRPKENKNTQLIIKLISNVHNQCSPEFIQNVEKVLNTLSPLLEIHDIGEPFVDNKKNQILREIQKSQEIENLVKNINDFNVEKVQQSLKQISTYFFGKLYDTNKINLEFQISKYNKSEEYLKIAYLNNQVSFSQNREGYHQMAYSKEKLDPNKYYKVQFSFKNNGGNANILQFIGLILNSDKDNSYYQNQKMVYCEYNYKYGIDQVKKGQQLQMKDIANANNFEKQYELRICISKRILQVLDFPKYENITEISNPNLLDEKQDYHLAVQTIYLHHTITINQINLYEDYFEE